MSKNQFFETYDEARRQGLPTMMMPARKSSKLKRQCAEK